MNEFDFSFFNLRFLDFIDILLVAIIVYYIYNLIRGTIAVNILIGLVIIYLAYLVVKQSQMRMLTEIFGGFISVGSLALIVVFQQEIRRFLIHIGKNISIRRHHMLLSLLFNRKDTEKDNHARLKPIIDACRSMQKTRTGALMVFSRYFDEEYYQNSGEHIDAHISKRLLECIFQKHSPLHDGAVVIVDFKIKTASAILPLSDSEDLPLQFGLRHRAAIGVTEMSDAIAVVVSEETGEISYAKQGNVNMNIGYEELEMLLNEDL